MLHPLLAPARAEKVGVATRPTAASTAHCRPGCESCIVVLRCLVPTQVVATATRNAEKVVLNLLGGWYPPKVSGIGRGALVTAW